MNSDTAQKVNAFWSAKREVEGLRLNWWQSKTIVRHINRKVCGVELDTFSGGLTQRAIEMTGGRTFQKGVSVGGGNGHKEMALIRAGLVDRFDIFELSEGRIDQGRQAAQKLGLEDRVEFHFGNAFEIVTREGCYDLVHWNNSLHHMMNVEEAIQWSYQSLAQGGLFYMDDFIGPSRFQWTERMLEIANRVRALLPSRYLRKPRVMKGTPKGLRKRVRWLLRGYLGIGGGATAKEIARPSIESMISKDPSEAADSARIPDMVRKYFPSAEIIFTGGVVYHLALNEIIFNFDEEKDGKLLRLLLLIDDLCSEMGENHYAVALAIKD